jgi:hypothetical protein
LSTYNIYLFNNSNKVRYFEISILFAILPKLESVDELFANIDINSFINDYNLGTSNKKLMTKYNIRSAISLQNLIISLIKEKKLKRLVEILTKLIKKQFIFLLIDQIELS